MTTFKIERKGTQTILAINDITHIFVSDDKTYAEVPLTHNDWGNLKSLFEG